MLTNSNHRSLIASGINKVCLCLCSAEQNGVSSWEGKYSDITRKDKLTLVESKIKDNEMQTVIQPTSLIEDLINS